MQKFFNRRQILRRAVWLSAGLIAGVGCGDSPRKTVDSNLDNAMRDEFARGEVVICNGYVLARSEYQHYKNLDWC